MPLSLPRSGCNTDIPVGESDGSLRRRRADKSVGVTVERWQTASKQPLNSLKTASRGCLQAV